MATLVFALLILSMAACSSATWCVCKDGVGEAALQKTLDYACGAGADCNPIHSNGPCFNPNTRKDHCDYAVNNYFQRKGQAAGSCDFAGTAAVTTTDPSSPGCVYPSSASGLSTTPVSTTPGMNMPSTTGNTNSNSAGNNPYITTPSGVLGGNGLGPSGVGINPDISGGAVVVWRTGLLSLPVSVLLSGVLFLWG